MFRYPLTLAIVMIAFNAFSQITFKKGYYIDNQGNKTECLIKDSGWKNAPNSFNYKMDEAGEVQKMKTSDVTEFAAGETKYIRAHVKYDQSSQELKMLTILSSPEWVEADLMLKVLVEGKANLYAYETSNLKLYFFNVDENPIEQLVYKNFIPDGDITRVSANRMYLSQINGKVRCMGVEPVTDKKVPYDERPLMKHFTNYNICSGDLVTKTITKPKTFSLRITPGVDFTSVTAQAGPRNYDFGNNAAIRLGAEAQFTLPFQHGKWAVILEPTYQSYNSNKFGGLKYNGLEFPIGIRHRFFLSDQSSIFVNVAALTEFPFSHTSRIYAQDIKVSNAIYGFMGGVGYSYGRFSLEARYYPKRERDLAGVVVYHYTKSTLILGFRVF